MLTVIPLDLDGIHPAWAEVYRKDAAILRQGWTAILGPYPLMPREIAVAATNGTDGRSYRTTYNLQEYLREVEAVAAFRDTYVGHRPTTLLHQDIQLRAYIDIDTKDVDDALAQGREFQERCEKEWSFSPEPFFSGNRSVHMHLGHPTFEASSEAYRDAWLNVIKEWGVFIDPQPLRNSRSMPRVPYSIHSKSVGNFGQVQFVVPIDLSWGAHEVLRASREVWTRRIDVPESMAVTQTLEPLCQKIDARLQKRRGKALPAGAHADLIQAAISFSESVGGRLRGRKGGKKGDGRRRVLMYLYIPALIWRCESNAGAVRDRAQTWIEATGGNWNHYKAFVEDSITRGLARDQPTLPMGLKKFIALHPDLVFPDDSGPAAPE